MNVEDVKEKPTEVPCRLTAIFHHQEDLAKKYVDVERKNGIGYGLLSGPFDLDDKKCQALMKDFAWRVTEELGEAIDAGMNPPLVGENVHAQEEIADGLHFLIELLIIAGMSEADFEKPILGEDRLKFMFLEPYTYEFHPTEHFLRCLGMAMNCLKNKPWKQTQFPTDPSALRQWLREALKAYIQVARTYQMTADTLYDMYFRKNQVNQFRVRSNY